MWFYLGKIIIVSIYLVFAVYSFSMYIIFLVTFPTKGRVDKKKIEWEIRGKWGKIENKSKIRPIKVMSLNWPLNL